MDIKLCQLHCYFRYPLNIKLYKILEDASHETDKKTINNFIKYCIYY